MLNLWQDLRYAVRQLRKSPGFTAVAVLTLALGIGANSAMFSVVNAVVLHPLPFRDADGIMTPWVSDAHAGGNSGPTPITDPSFREWRDHNTAFKQIAAYRGQTSNLTGGGDPVRLMGSEASASLFPLLGVNPVLGRTFSPTEESAGHNHAALLSYKLWQSPFGADPAMVGKAIKLDGQFFTVVGVMPHDFGFPNEAEFWTPLALTNDAGNASLRVIARLRPGVTIEHASSEAALLTRHIDLQNHRDDSARWKMTLVPLGEEIAAGMRTSLFVLLGAVGLVLLIGCVNVANLLLARAVGRQHEIAIRSALGASRMRVIRQILTESTMLAALGGALGLVFAAGGHGFLSSAIALFPGNIGPSPSVVARIASSGVEPWVLSFTFTISLVTGILFGLAPAIQASKPRLSDALKEGSRISSETSGRGYFRDALVTGEMALALILLVGAGLLIRSFLNLISVNPGFDPQNVLSMNVELPESRYSNQTQMIAFEQQALNRLRALPGVRSSGSVFGLPLSDSLLRGDISVEGQPAPMQEGVWTAKIVVGGDYFSAMGLPLLNGRYFSEHDTQSSPHVAVVSQSMARRLWPGQDPIGKRLMPGISPDSWCMVVGVVGDVKQSGLQDHSSFALYLPYPQSPLSFMMRSLTLVIRSASDGASMTSAARHAIAAVDPDLPLFDTASMEQLVYRSLSEPRFNTFLLGIFASLALLLAALGIYGVMSYVVTRRTHEIGVRMALGAQQSAVLRQVLGRVMLLTAAGITVGLLGALILTRFLTSLLYNIRPTDAATYIAVSLVLMTTALLAGYIPARRAAKVDPMVALRYE